MEMKGGDKLSAYLRELEKKIKNGASVNVGFLSGSTETASGLPCATVAYWNEYGGTITMPARTATVTRDAKTKRFSKPSKSTIETTHNVGTYTIKRPPRPFFRGMISAGEDHWGQDLGQYLTQQDMDASLAMKFIGEQMVEELQASIMAPGYAPLAKSTAKKKGHSDTLRDSLDMLRAVNFEVKGG